MAQLDCDACDFQTIRRLIWKANAEQLNVIVFLRAKPCLIRSAKGCDSPTLNISACSVCNVDDCEVNYPWLFNLIYFYWLVSIKQFVVVFGKCSAEVLGSVWNEDEVIKGEVRWGTPCDRLPGDVEPLRLMLACKLPLTETSHLQFTPTASPHSSRLLFNLLLLFFSLTMCPYGKLLLHAKIRFGQFWIGCDNFEGFDYLLDKNKNFNKSFTNIDTYID